MRSKSGGSPMDCRALQGHRNALQFHVRREAVVAWSELCTSLSGPTCLWTALPAWLPGSAHALRFVLRMTANAVTSSRYNVRVRWRMSKDGWLNGKSMGSSLGRLPPANHALERNARPAASVRPAAPHVAHCDR